MPKNFEIKKKKKIKSWLSKTMLYKVLPAYLAFLSVTAGTVFALLAFNLPAIVYAVTDVVFIALLVIAAILICAVIIPRCRARQAMLDFENYDFSPHTAEETETFSQELQTEKYYFTPSPFDDDEGIIELTSSKAADDYFSQFAPERLKCVEQLRASGEFIPFNIFDFNDEYFNGTAEKRREGEYVTVTVTEKPEITFAPDGVHIGEQVFTYEQREAYIFAEFVQPYARVSVSVNIILSDEFAVSFAFGTRIMSIINKHRIFVQNQELADFILSDPARAFKLIGLKRKISKNKLLRQRCNNQSSVI